MVIRTTTLIQYNIRNGGENPPSEDPSPSTPPHPPTQRKLSWYLGVVKIAGRAIKKIARFTMSWQIAQYDIVQSL
jgi:hypothetical protein